MAREFSAGGVVLHSHQGAWEVAVIEPRREPAQGKSPPRRRKSAPVLALPKGLVDEGEKAEETAVREVREETGVEARIIAKLADIKYFYVRTWSDQQRVFKIVSFFLLLYGSGKIGEISDDMRIEVERALWLPLDEAAQRLTYKGEREVLRKAQQYLQAHAELAAGHTGPRKTRESA